MKTYTVKSRFVDVTGPLYPARYSEDRWALALQDNSEGMATIEVLSVNLVGHGIEQPAGHVFVKTYSEHWGLPDAVEAAGLATKVGDAPVPFGPYDATAWLMKLSDEVVAQYEAEGAR